MNGVALRSDELQEMRENIRREVFSLEECWHCKNIASCEKAVLAKTVIVWICVACFRDKNQQLKQNKISPLETYLFTSKK